MLPMSPKKPSANLLFTQTEINPIFGRNCFAHQRIAARFMPTLRCLALALRGP
jgi:hypothetical protein